MGNVQSAGAAASLGMSFVSIQLVLLVGICGAMPCGPDGQEIILGDVIVSEVLVRLDFGRQYPTGFKRKDTILDGPGKLNEEILGLLQHWKSQVMAQQLHAKMMQHLIGLVQHPSIGTEYPTSSDQLFAPDYIHRHHTGCVECSLAESVCATALNASCEELECDQRMLVHRARRSGRDGQGISNQQIHFGSIGTADMVMKSAWHRNQLAASEGIIAFEMEGAGVWDKFNCLIIKGVCDYADSHKNKKWQSYAAAVAAAAAKEVLEQYVPHDRPESSNRKFSTIILTTWSRFMGRWNQGCRSRALLGWEVSC
jgi:nucleoside phosphorylase